MPGHSSRARLTPEALNLQFVCLKHIDWIPGGVWAVAVDGWVWFLDPTEEAAKQLASQTALPSVRRGSTEQVLKGWFMLNNRTC